MILPPGQRACGITLDGAPLAALSIKSLGVL